MRSRTPNPAQGPRDQVTASVEDALGRPPALRTGIVPDLPHGTWPGLWQERRVTDGLKAANPVTPGVSLSSPVGASPGRELEAPSCPVPTGRPSEPLLPDAVPSSVSSTSLMGTGCHALLGRDLCRFGDSGQCPGAETEHITSGSLGGGAGGGTRGCCSWRPRKAQMPTAFAHCMEKEPRGAVLERPCDAIG